MSVEVKICGLSTAESVDCAVSAGADFIGFVFYPPSPRYVSPQKASGLADRARGRAKIVALVVDADDELLREIVDAVAPDMFQAHGSEPPARVAEISAMTNCPVMKAIKVRDPEDIASAAAYETSAAMVLFDAKAPESLKDALPGGNGIAFDWSLLGSNRRQPRFMLSGGLDASNVAEAIRVTGAPVVDVSTGVEDSPGQKNLERIRKFVEAARTAR